MRRTPLLALAAVALVAMAGCGGGSSSSTSSSSSTTASASSSPSARRAAINACLKKQGITPPQRRPGGGGGPFLGGGQGNGRFRSALQKCGITPGAGFGRRFSSPQFRQALQRFVSCVRSNGYNLPAPNLSGTGPVFDPSKVNRNDPKFQAATRKCQGLLRFGRPGGGPPGGGGPA